MLISKKCSLTQLVTDTELKSQALIHKHSTEQKEMLIRCYEKHRLLCDKIIQEQRALINSEYNSHTLGLKTLSTETKYAMWFLQLGSIS